MVIDAHVRAFEYFGGIPRRGIYDNMKTAVQKILRGKQIASHQRRFTRGETYYNWQHYLPILARKPGALRNGAPFKQMSLPEELETVQQHLQCRPSGAKEFIQILSYISETSMDAVQDACREAIQF